MKYGYYPGCSLERNAAAYHDSAMAVAAPLGLEFVEVNQYRDEKERENQWRLRADKILSLRRKIYA